MNLLSILAGGAIGLAKGLFGGGGTPTGGQALASQIIEKVLPETAKEKEAAALAANEADVRDEESARKYNAPDMPVVVYQSGMGLIPWILLWMLDLIDHIVDSVNHMIRPAGIIWAALVLTGTLPLPAVTDAKIWTVFFTMITFFYGGRALVKDILPGLKDILGAMKK